MEESSRLIKQNRNCTQCAHYRYGKGDVVLAVEKMQTYGKGVNKKSIIALEDIPVKGDFCLYYKVQIGNLDRAQKCGHFSPLDSQTVLDI